MGTWKAVKGLRNYNFVSFGVEDETRISAFSLSYYKVNTWNYWVKNTTRSGEVMQRLFNSWWNGAVPIEETRREKGLFIKIGKFLTAMGLPGQNSCLCDNIAEKMRMRARTDTSTIRVTGDVSGVYSMPHKGAGTLGSSCMRGENKRRFLIYDDIGCKIAYTLDGEYLTGRALLHDNVQTESGPMKIMDRIYFDTEKSKALFCAWAAENGYTRKAEQKLNCDTYILPNGQEIEGDDMFIETGLCLLERYDEVPYIDTFAYYSEQEGRLYASYNSGVDTTLKETNGSDSEGIIADNNADRCCCCDSRDDDGQYYNDDFYCSVCFGERFDYCERCDEYEDVNGFVEVRSENIYVCSSCAENFYFTCDDCGEIFSNDDSILTHNSNRVCPSCLDTDYFTCDECQEIHPNNEANDTDDNRILCDDCYEENETEVAV